MPRHLLIGLGLSLGMVFLIISLPLAGWLTTRARRREQARFIEEYRTGEMPRVRPEDYLSETRTLRSSRIRDLEQTHDLSPRLPAPAPVAVPKPVEEIWVGEQTQEWSITEVVDGEVVEETALLPFHEDPLGSWTVPPEESDLEYLPEALGTFERMVMRGELTGVGGDIDAEWHEWNLEGAR